MAFFCQKTCVCEKIAVLLRPISRSRAVVARQAHNLKVGGSIPSSATKESASALFFYWKIEITSVRTCIFLSAV